MPAETILFIVRGMSLKKEFRLGISRCPVTFNQDLKALVPHEGIFPLFLAYAIKSKTNEILGMVGEAGHGTGVLPTDRIERLEIPVPEIIQQKRIVHVLKSLDDKIELNHQINQTLEEMAQAIFKSWFVDFEPVKAKIEAKVGGQDPERAAMCAISGKSEAELNQLPPDQLDQLQATAVLFPDELTYSELGLIPKGWEVVPFSQIADLNTTSVKPHDEKEKLWEYYSIPAFDESEYPSFEMGSEIKSNKYKVHPSALLVSKLNPHFPRIWWPAVEVAKAAICSTEFMQFIPKQAAHRAFVYSMVISPPFQQGILQRVTGTTGSRQRAQPKSVAEMLVLNPGEKLICSFVSICENMFLQKEINIKENKTIVQLRDTLLPKLLSGEITVGAAQASIKEAV